MSTLDRSAEKILYSIKSLLKNKKIKYAELAKAIDVSLPTVKRRLNSTNLSLKEMDQICQVLGVRVDDLLALSQKDSEEVLRFSMAQEIFFAENPSYLAYFFELRKNQSPLVIEKKHQISRKSTKQYLKELSRIGLVKINGINSVSTPSPTTTVYDDHGPLGRVFSKEMLRELTNRMLSQFGQPTKAYLALWGRSLTQTDVQELKREFEILEKKYRKLSDYNRRVFRSEELHNISCAIIADEWDPQVFSKVIEL